MPFLDVSEITLDPDFADFTLVCTRNAQQVSNGGMAAEVEFTCPFAGVVTSKDGRNLDRTAEGSRITGTIYIHTIFQLREGGDNYDADIVTWDGKNYTVTSIDDYSTYGIGFVCATCDLIPLSGGSVDA